jgi:hypothetical protein
MTYLQGVDNKGNFLPLFQTREFCMKQQDEANLKPCGLSGLLDKRPVAWLAVADSGTGLASPAC